MHLAASCVHVVRGVQLEAEIIVCRGTSQATIHTNNHHVRNTREGNQWHCARA